MKIIVRFCLFVLIAFFIFSFNTIVLDRDEVLVSMQLDQEDIRDGQLLTSSTLSIVKGNHEYRKCENIKFEFINDHLIAKAEKDNTFINLKNLPIRFLLPVLYYKVKGEGDDFDAFNLMLAEYSRNGVSIPYGNDEDQTIHFQTNLEESHPYYINDNAEFIPNPNLRPLRVSLVNNCLAPGLWEFSAKDRSGEIFHSWVNMPKERYFKEVAKENGLNENFVKKSLSWHEENVKIDLQRLRTLGGNVNKFEAQIPSTEVISFSSQDARRKLSRGFVKVLKDGEYVFPEKMDDLSTYPIKMNDFVEPGKYSSDKFKEFDIRFMRNVNFANIQNVKPLTYIKGAKHKEQKYIEVNIDLGEHQIIIGNLPLNLIVEQEDFVIPGFGVGILKSSELAERRKLRFQDSPRPSFAYFVKENNGDLLAINTHALGLEEIYIRQIQKDQKLFLRVVVTSFERMVDLISYEIELKGPLKKELLKIKNEYVTPIYASYRDDNVR